MFSCHLANKPNLVYCVFPECQPIRMQEWQERNLFTVRLDTYSRFPLGTNKSIQEATLFIIIDL